MIERIAESICQSVAEIPDRSSPDDAPDMMLVTADELHTIVVCALESEAEFAASERRDNLLTALAKIMPITFENGPDYMSLFFGDDSGTHSTQAMTMHPQDWLDLQAAYEVATPKEDNPDGN